VLVRSLEIKDSNIAQIRPQDVSFAAKIRSLVEGRKDALGKSVVCVLNVKQPSMAAPHRVENNTFLFHSADVIYQYECKRVIVDLIESEFCYRYAPIEPVGKYKFMSLENRML